MKLSDSNELHKDPLQYRQLIGCLIYLTITQPDTTYLVRVLSRFLHAPCKPHMKVAILMLCYLKSILGQGLIFDFLDDF